MSTAAVGVATFAAVMVFDAVDSPTVTFTTTSAGDNGAGVPTAAVVTDEVEVERQSQSAAEPAASPPPSQAAANAVQEEEAEETAAVAAVEVEEEQQQAAQQANWQAQEESADEPVEQVSASSKEAAADDPSRRAITAGRAGSDAGDSDAEQVTAADVVQQEETVTEEAEVEQAEASEPTAAEVSEDDDSSHSAAADESTKAVGDDQAQASSQTQVERRTVATSVRHSESDWPLEQRPRSSTVELARDPSWEGPVQIVLAVVAIGATLLWLGLTNRGPPPTRPPVHAVAMTRAFELARPCAVRRRIRRSVLVVHGSQIVGEARRLPYLRVCRIPPRSSALRSSGQVVRTPR